jgi:hypothetical protein
MILLVRILLLIQSLFGRGWIFEEKTLHPHIDVPWIRKGRVEDARDATQRRGVSTSSTVLIMRNANSCLYLWINPRVQIPYCRKHCTNIHSKYLPKHCQTTVRHTVPTARHAAVQRHRGMCEASNSFPGVPQILAGRWIRAVDWD